MQVGGYKAELRAAWRRRQVKQLQVASRQRTCQPSAAKQRGGFACAGPPYEASQVGLACQAGAAEAPQPLHSAQREGCELPQPHQRRFDDCGTSVVTHHAFVPDREGLQLGEPRQAGGDVGGLLQSQLAQRGQRRQRGVALGGGEGQPRQAEGSQPRQLGELQGGRAGRAGTGRCERADGGFRLSGPPARQQHVGR